MLLSEAPAPSNMPLSPRPLAADIFCRVIDNYGDIGVCWRLAKTLAHDHGWQIRLWLDLPQALQKLQPEASFHHGLGKLEGIELVHWTDTPPDLAPLDICIEAFACDPPARYLARLAPATSRWLNLEYLSAEDWVASYHLLPSRQANGVSKYFFFPGFQTGTGGLLREPGLLAQRDAWQANPSLAQQLLASLGLPDTALTHWRQPGSRLVNLFCYPHAPLQALIDALAHSQRPTLLLVPEGVAPKLQAGQRGALYIARHPFVRQAEFDRLLWSADLNLVRGEDSLVRAIWAGRPLLWHIYPQEENVHLEKLQAWLALGSLPASVRDLFLSWNATPGTPAYSQANTTTLDSSWAHLLDTPSAWHAWQEQARQDSNTQALQADLATQLTTHLSTSLSR